MNSACADAMADQIPASARRDCGCGERTTSQGPSKSRRPRWHASTGRPPGRPRRPRYARARARSRTRRSRWRMSTTPLDIVITAAGAFDALRYRNIPICERLETTFHVSYASNSDEGKIIDFSHQDTRVLLLAKNNTAPDSWI